jgi:16S rRNA (uracil1498-N3)-methyltransferase
MIRVFVPAAEPPLATLTPDEAHHLTRVLRARAGDAVIAFDGRGREWDARVATVAKDTVTIALASPRTPVPEPTLRVVLGVALLKGDQMDDVVRDATMLGVAAIQPIVSARVVVPDRARSARSLERWARIAVASAKQCGRATVPEIRAIDRFDAVLHGTEYDAVLMCAEPARGARGTLTDLARAASVLVLIGPEGGWSPDERAAAEARGATIVTLGPRTLRAETAPVVALSALWTASGWQ